MDFNEAVEAVRKKDANVEFVTPYRFDKEATAF